MEWQINIVMFEQMLDKKLMTENDKTLLDLVLDDIKQGTYKVIAMVGRSGAGKTATLVDLARQHFIVYCTCSQPRGAITGLDFPDSNFVTLAKDVEILMLKNIQQPNTLQEMKDNDALMKLLAGERIELEFLARLLFLQLLFKMKPELAPEQFFCEQINEDGTTTIENIVRKLCKYDTRKNSDMLSYLRNGLTKNLHSQQKGLVIALDEAQIAGNSILAGKLISPSALSSINETHLYKNELRMEFRRGFLTPLCATLSNMHVILVVLGTSMSLSDTDHVHTAISKNTKLK
jgi:hypothetical protein